MSAQNQPQNLPQINSDSPQPMSSGQSAQLPPVDLKSQLPVGGTVITNPLLPNGGQVQSAKPTTRIPVPKAAADSDLIEKEWVERAKQIVAHTRDNPYEQQKAISKMKADYMKKRYNKIIKLAEE